MDKSRKTRKKDALRCSNTPTRRKLEKKTRWGVATPSTRRKQLGGVTLPVDTETCRKQGGEINLSPPCIILLVIKRREKTLWRTFGAHNLGNKATTFENEQMRSFSRGGGPWCSKKGTEHEITWKSPQPWWFWARCESLHYLL